MTVNSLSAHVICCVNLCILAKLITVQSLYNDMFAWADPGFLERGVHMQKGVGGGGGGGVCFADFIYFLSLISHGNEKNISFS